MIGSHWSGFTQRNRAYSRSLARTQRVAKTGKATISFDTREWAESRGIPDLRRQAFGNSQLSRRERIERHKSSPTLREPVARALGEKYPPVTVAPEQICAIPGA